MLEGLLPLFPLEVVLLPQTPLPLHIFEERYKEMIAECLEARQEFGVVLVRGNGVLRTGCSASIEEVLRRQEDGEMDILTMGRRRFELRSVDAARSFLQGDVEFFDDDDFRPVEPACAEAALAAFQELKELAQSDLPKPPADHPRLSFQLAQVTPDLEFRQELLQMRSEADRMERLAGHLAHLAVRQKARNAMREVSRSNGRAKHLPPPAGAQ
jgi:Lon protease-like protein